MLGIEAAIAIALSAAPPRAAPAAPEEEMACAGLALNWGGAVEDIRQIAHAPVPASYRALYFQGGCGSGLVPESLIDWHLAFGDEASVTAALAFFEQDYLAHGPAPGAFPGTLAQAWRAARSDLRAAGPLLSRPNPDFDHGRHQLDASPRVIRLRALLEAYRRLGFLANQYLRAAEFHGSTALLAKARLHFDAAEAGMMSLNRLPPPSTDGLNASVYSYLNLDEDRAGQMRDIGMRLAILQARLSRDPADIDIAARIVDANYSPVLRLAAENADRQDDFCNSGHGDRLDPIRVACEEDIDFPSRSARFWRNQALLDTLMAADPVHYVVRPREQHSESSGSSYVRAAAAGVANGDAYPESFIFAASILDRAKLDNQLVRSFSGGIDDNLVTLYLARADMYARLAARARASGSADAAREAAGMLTGALNDLTNAERLSPPAEEPGRFRQIAELYLPLAERLARDRRAESNGERGDNPAHAREAAYLREVLARLGQIAASEFPPDR